MRFATLYIPDFPIWAVELFEPSLRGRDIIVQRSGRVAARSERLRAAGIACAWTVERARAQAPEAVVRAHPGARVPLAWDLVLETLTTRTPWVEPRATGAFIHVPPEARERALLDVLGDVGLAVLGLDEAEIEASPRGGVHALARVLRACVGVAGDRATSFLAALHAPRGGACVVGEASAARFRDQLPLTLTAEAGISAETRERLRWLGFETVGQLRRLTPSQLRAQFPEGPALNALARTDDRRPVGVFTPPPAVRAEHESVSRLLEPAAWMPIIDDLLEQCLRGLENRAAQMVRVSLAADGRWRTARRLCHAPTAEARSLSALARIASGDIARHFPEGVDGVTVALEGLVAAPRHQARLWGDERASLTHALEALEKRLPGASLRVVGLDLDAYLPEEAYHLLSVAAVAQPKPTKAKSRR